MNIKIRKSEYNKLFESYQSGMSMREVAENYGVSTSCIGRIFKKEGYSVRKYKHFKNEHYFEKIDSESKAYFLGLIYADGWVNNKKNYFGICLAEEDKYLLEQFKKELKFTGPIKNVGRKKDHHKDRYRIEICSKKMCRDLEGLNVIPNKALILQFPTEELVPNELMPHFLRGYFDGDGYVGYKKMNYKTSNFIKGSLVCSIVSSPCFCNSLQNFLKNQLNINCYNRCDGRSKAHDLKFSSRQALVFLDYIYKNSSENLLMRRKFNIFKNSLFEYRMSNLNHTHGSKVPIELVKEICFREKYALI